MQKEVSRPPNTPQPKATSVQGRCGALRHCADPAQDAEVLIAETNAGMEQIHHDLDLFPLFCGHIGLFLGTELAQFPSSRIIRRHSTTAEGMLPIHRGGLTQLVRANQVPID